MAKKKNNRQKHQQDTGIAPEDTSDEELNNVNSLGKKCPHITRGVQFGRVKKCLKSCTNILICNGCLNDKDGEFSEVWLCLQCGYRGCGRISESKHAFQHFKTIHSDCHSLVLSTTSGSVWCYDCDNEINIQTSNVLKQVVDFIMKMAQNTSFNAMSTNRTPEKKNMPNDIKEEPIVSKVETEPDQKVQKKLSNKENTQKVKVKGLKNLGNTCFFNAVMQNLTQTHILFHELMVTKDSAYSLELPVVDIINDEAVENENEIIKISAGQQFSLSSKLLNFFESMNSKSTGKNSIVDPHPLFSEISIKCPQFRHYQQQDSHELLRQLLDNIRQEEIKRQKLAILKHFGHTKGSTENMKEEIKKKIRAYRFYASHTFIEKIFGGLLISIVTCEECEKSSQVLEPFMDLSLPLFEEKQQEHDQLNAMLDGGKQDHIKPLRNRKNDFESEESTHEEHILTKPKIVGKPSKYQEKKQKQLSKKEKKKAAKIAKNRSNSQSELWDNSNPGELLDNNVNENDNKTVNSCNIDSQENSVNNDSSPDKSPGKDNKCDSVMSEQVLQNSEETNDFNKSSKINSNRLEDISECIYENGEISVTPDDDQISSMDTEIGRKIIYNDYNTLNKETSNNFENFKDVISVKSSVAMCEISFCDNRTSNNFEDSKDDKISVKSEVAMCEFNFCGNQAQNCDNFYDSKNQLADNSKYTVEEILSTLNDDVGETKVCESQNVSNSESCEIVNLEKDEATREKNENIPENELSNSNKILTRNSNEFFIISEYNESDQKENELENNDYSFIHYVEEPDDKIPEMKYTSAEMRSKLVLDFSPPNPKSTNQEKVANGSPSVNDSVQQLTDNFSDSLCISNSPKTNHNNEDELIKNSEKENGVNSTSADESDSMQTFCTSSKSSVEDDCSNDSCDNLCASVSTVQSKEWISRLTTTFKPRYQASSLECSIYSCLSHFTKPELLTGNNKFRCENCTESKIKKTGNKKEVAYTNANKQILVFSPPAILTLHLKRFQQTGMSLRKINRFVEFPLLLDLAPFCSSVSSGLPHMSAVEDEILYSLYGIVEHSGRLTSGHYTAYVKAGRRRINRTFECHFPLCGYNLEQLLHRFSNHNTTWTDPENGVEGEDQWFYISDTHVKEVSEAQVLKCQAYILFYERIK